jgi:hypothetical protein
MRPAPAIRTARDAIKVERAGVMLHLARNVGRIEAKAGPRTAFDGLQVAASPREMSRIDKLAEKEGTKTRAIIKVAAATPSCYRSPRSNWDVDYWGVDYGFRLADVTQECDGTFDLAHHASRQGILPAQATHAPDRLGCCAPVQAVPPSTM